MLQLKILKFYFPLFISMAMFTCRMGDVHASAAADDTLTPSTLHPRSSASNQNIHSAVARSSLQSSPGTEDVTLKVHNLMWVYKSSGLDDGKYLSPDGLILERAIEWAKLNPGFQVHINYDREFTSKEAIRETLQAIVASEYGKQITLRNLRQLPHVLGQNTSAFRAECPIECRLDLLRVIKSHNDLTTTKFDYSSYADLDVTPCDLQAIINGQKEDLANYGMLMAREDRNHDNGNAPRFENCFHIFSRQPVFLRCLDRVLIQPSIIRLRLLSHVMGHDETLQDELVVKEFKRLLKLKNLKTAFKMEALANKEFVYEKFEPVLIALHNNSQSLSYVVALGNNFDLDFANGTVKPSGFGSLDSFLCNPAAQHGTDRKAIGGKALKPGGAKIFEEDMLYVPTTPMQFPPSKLLQDD